MLITRLFSCILVAAMLLLNGCQNTRATSAREPDASSAQEAATRTPAPDYSSRDGWLAFPASPDGHGVDVLWFYPTVAATGGMLMDTTDPDLLRAARDTIAHQASVFAENADIYAPLYRQLNRNGFSLPLEEVNAYLAVGQKDMWRAIRHYLEHLNHGKPFILAGHSQGSSSLLEVLVEHWGETGAEDRLVAAYVIGWSVTPEDISRNPNIRMCENATDTGCFISYNSVKDGCQGESIQIRPGAFVTNPLSWESGAEDGEFVPASENLGAVFFPAGQAPRPYPHFTSAQVKGSGLACQVADPGVLSPSPTPEGIYHRDDYSLFYENLKANAAERIKAFSARAARK